MHRLFALALCLFLLPVIASAESPPSETQSDANDLTRLRKSGTYQDGLAHAREFFDMAYDVGAVRGLTRWKVIHGYYLELADAKGCKKGMPFAKGPVQACRKIKGREPELLGKGYKEGKREVIEHSTLTLYPDLAEKVLLIVYDYGYAKGMKHGLRRYNDDILWGQTFYKSCLQRANDSEHEPICASASKEWSEGLLDRLRAELESHGLPVGRKRK
ncbi:MAG: hypothetical protein ACN4G0_18625 [Polyangiales bacterium]